MADNRNISLSDRLRAKGVQVGPLKTTPHQRVVGDTMAGQRNPETGLTQRLIDKGVKINFVPSRSQSSQEQQASTQDTQAPFQSNLKETQLEVTKSNAELEIPRSNADRQKIRSAKDSDSLSKVLNEQDYMGEDQKAAQHLKVAQHAEKMAANAERSFENAQRGNFKSSKLLQGIYEQYGGKTTPSGQVVFENPAAAKLYDETAQQIANDKKQRAENFAAVQKNSEQEVENNEKRKEEASQHIILDVAPQKKQNYVSMSQADFDSAYGKVSVQQTISLQQAISEYTNLLVQKNAFEKEYGYTGNDFIWEDGNLEAEYDALEEAEEAAFEKMRNEYNAFLKTDAPKNDLYAQLILMYYTRAFDEHALDSYLDANNIKVLVSDTDSDLQNVKNSINNTVYKEHMQTVKNYQEFIAHYDERIAEISSDPLFMMSDIFLLQAANEQRQYEAYLKRNPDGVPPETDSKEDWTYFVASVVSSEDYADYAYVDKEILYPAIYQQKGKQQPTYEQQPAYAKNVQQGNLSENEKLFLAVNGASTRTNMALGFTTYMSDDEIAVFNYLYQNPKYGPAVAKKFYEAITPDLKTRSTSNMEYLAAVRRADDVSDFGRIAEIAYAGVTGLANGLIGLVQWIPGTEDWNKTNTMASQIVRQNQPYLLRQVSNAAESIGFMTPSLVASYFGGPIAGAATTFASSGGRAAAEGREMGMSTAQSIGYGMLVGGAEAGFQYMLGGISQLRGTQSSFFGNLAKKAATTAGKMAVKFVGNVTSEIVEENLQNYWEPACKMIVGFTDQYDAPTVQDFIDTTISTIITTGVIEASNIKSTKAIMQYEQEVIAPWVEEALKYAKSGSNMQAIATKFKGMLDSGETITPKEFIDSCESITEEDKNDYTNAVIEEVQKRVEAVQMSNPEAQVVTSASTQSYLNQGIDLKTAQQAGEVLDGIVSGEITSENLSNNQIEKLNLMQPNMAAVASETLGLEIERPNSKSAARNTARQVIAQYAQQKASTASSGQDISMQQQTPVTTEAETEAAPQTTSEASTAMPETVTAPSIQTVSAPQTSPEASAATPEASVPIAQSPAVEQTTAVSSQKAQAEGKGNFITEYVAKNPNATDTEISAAYDAYRNGGTVTSSTARDTANPTIQTMEASTKTETSSAKTNANNAVDEQQKQSNATLDYLQFEEEYKSNNPKASMNDIAVAYQRYLNGEEIVDTKQSTGEAMSYKQFRKQYLKEHKKATPDEIEYAYNKYLNEPTDSKKYSVKEYGVVRDEYSEKVPEKAVEAVDALAKLFKLNIHFAELGEDNGLYDPDTGEIWLDIHPHKAFEFVAGHEIAHALKARISEAAWNNFERYAVKAMGGKTAVAEKQTISEKYAKESDAREEVACDFVGKLLSDKQMLKDFCYAVEHRQIRPEAAKGLINVWKWFTGKFTNMTKKGDTETAELVAKVKEAFDTDIKTATEAIKALQTAYQEATKSDALRKTENTTNDGGVKNSKKEKNNTKTSAASPLSRGLAEQESLSMASKPVTAAANNLSIDTRLTQIDDSVKQAILIFSDIVDAIDRKSSVRGSKKPITADNLTGILVANGIMQRHGVSRSVYAQFGNHTLRISDHSAHADNFTTDEENLSISLMRAGKTNEFSKSDRAKVIEAKFRKEYLNKHPNEFRKLIEDMAKFVVNGEYHDTAGALDYNLSGGKDFEMSAIFRLYDDAIQRNDTAMAGKLVGMAAERAGYVIHAYHGSPRSFNEFSLKYLGTNGTAEGYGFYFTSDRNIAERYTGREGKEGRIYDSYLKIEKPLSDKKLTITKTQLRKYLIKLNNTIGEAGEPVDILSNYGDTEYEGVNNVVNEAVNSEYEYNDNDVDLIHSIMNTSGDKLTCMRVLRETLGYDGIVVNDASWGGEQTIYLAFHPDQIKLADPVTYDDNGNVIPLSERFNEAKKDIRYAKKTTSDAEFFATEEGQKVYAENYGNLLETDAQIERAAARDEARAEEARQKIHAGETVREANKLLNEEMQKAAEQRLEERRRRAFTPDKKATERDYTEMSKEELAERLAYTEKSLKLEKLKKEHAQEQLKRTSGSKVDPTGIYSFVRKTLKEFDQGAVTQERVQEATKSLVSVFDKAAEIYDKLKDSEASAMLLWEHAQKMMEDIVQESKIYSVEESDSLYEQYSELRKELSSTTFLLPKQFASDISPEFAKWKNKYFGKFNVKLVEDGTGNIDSIYHDLAEAYPGLFRDSQSSEPDLLLQIANVAERIYTKPKADTPLWKVVSNEDIEAMTLNLYSNILMEFVRVEQNPRLQTRLDKVIARYEKKLADLRTSMQEKAARDISDAAKKERVNNEKETLRIVKYYENQLERIEKEYDKQVKKIKNAAKRNAKKSELKEAFAKDDAIKKYEKLDRSSKRKIAHLTAAKNAQIERLKRVARQNAIANTVGGAEALRAIQKVWQDKGEDFKVLSLEDISTKTINASDISKKRSKSESIKKFYTEARRAFVTDIVEIEDFARNQSRVDNANVMATMYKNSGSMVETIQTGKLYSPDGEVIDDRSLASVAICWKDDKVGGKIDTQSQELYEKYLFHKHGYDRMSIEQKVRQEMDAFLSDHPEYNKSNTTHLRQKEILVKAKNGDNVAAEYIEIAKRFAEAKNKAVMGTEDGTKVNAQTHKMIFESIEKTSPWVAQKASELYAWWDKFMNAWVVGSELSSEQYARMKELYPHYVPTYRAFEKTDNGVYVTNKDGTTVRKSIKAAKGSTMDLMKVEDSLAVQVAKIVENRRFNDLALNIVHESIFATDFDVDNYQKAIYGYDSRKDNTSSGMKGNNIENYVLFAGDMDGNESTSSSTDDLYMQTEKSEKNRLIEDKDAIVLTAWENGVAVRAYVSKGLKKSLDALTGSYNPLSTAIKIGNKLTGIQKAAITGYNPFFAARNVPRDFALANVNSIAGLAFAKYETIAIAKMVSGDADWQRFKALGGTEANYYESESGFAKNIAKGKNVAAKASKAAGAFNNATESMTRFAEYLATIERLGDTPEGRARAIKNAAEITVDFSRHGTVGKLLNAWIPYWNPQVQGMSRLFRSVFEAKDVKVALKTLGKATAASVLPEALLMALLHAVGAYDDWEELDDRTKDAYYAIPIGGGKFIKIAKGREWAQLIGNPLMRIWQGLNGREDPFKHYWETSIASNFMVPSELSLKGVLDATGVTDAVFLSQYIDLETNKDFAGRTIIPYEYQNASPSEQYDENTSWLAKKIGKLLDVSPMKIDYVIGDYFGDFGDMLIEATNESNNTFGNEFLDTALSSFVVDSAYSSRINTDYYDMIDEITLQANDKKLRDPSYKDAIETKVKSAIENYYQVQISDLRNQISEEKNEDKKRLLTLEIRGLQEAAVEFYEKCMSGEIEEPVLYLEYAPYGDAVRNELIRLKEYNSEDYDYSFVPYPVAPNIGDHKNTDEEKANYTSIYESYYSDVVGDVISSNAYANADDEGKLNMLEGARELVHFYSKRDYAKAYDLSSDSYDPASAENKYDAIMQAGATFAEAHNIISSIASLEPIGDAESVTSVQMWKQILATENLTPEITDAAMRVYMTGSQEEKYDVMINSGLDPSSATSVMLKARQIDSEDKTINQKETSFSSWVDQRPWTSQQKNAAKDSYAFTSINVGKSEKYDQLVNEYGFSSQKAEKAYLEISSLEPENGKDYVSDSQRNSKIVSMDFLTNAEQYSLLLSYYDTEYNKDTYKKIKAAQSKGISAKNYVKTWQEIAAIKGTDKNNDGITDTNSLKNNIAKYLRNASHLTYSQKCWFWRLRYSSGSEDGWKYNW